MEGRGRKSAASLAVISGKGIETVRRPDAPDELTEEQAAEWKAVVNRLPADWFPRETFPMLAQYCRHVISARRVSEMIRGLEDLIINNGDGDTPGVAALKAAETLDRLLKMQEREGRALSSLATRMRITQQATYDKSKKKPLQSKKPWEN